MKTYQVKYINKQLPINADINRDNIWNEANKNTDFSYAGEDKHCGNTTFMALHNGEHLYFRFEVTLSDILTFIVENHKMEVVNSERIELFFCKDKSLNPYYCLELDATGRVLDYITRYYRDFDYEWSWQKDHLLVQANQHQNGYVIEGAITLASLKNYGVLIQNEILTGLFRGYCTALPQGNESAKLRWITWVNPKVNQPDFHIPEVFGKLILEEK